jgi:putative nucleotidyltransferase with HDIG domain
LTDKIIVRNIDPIMEPYFETATVSSAAVEGHCRRTAAVAKLIAHQMFWPSEDQHLLTTACLLHHRCVGLLAPKSMERLLAGIFGENAPALVVADCVPVIVRGVLNAYDVPGSGTALESKLAGILRVADAFDQEMEAQPVDAVEVGDIIERLRGGVEAGLWSGESINALEQSTRPASFGQAESWRLPVSPLAALRTLRLMRNPRASIADVVEAASLDPASAGLVIKLANSALFGSRTLVSTLSQAIGRLGFATSQKAITSTAMQRVFSSSRLREVWQHSLQVADLAEQLACRIGTIDPAEAYLAGLLHDVGQVALLSMQFHDSARLQGLVSDGCPAVYAENLVLRTDHAALGAQIAEGWRLPETMVSAIRQHHRPEKAESSLAHLLYIAEDLSGSEEDLPSLIRLEASLKGIGLALDDASDYTVSALGEWLAAA